MLGYVSTVLMRNLFFFFSAVEIDDLKKITNSLTVLCSEKQKQEKVRRAPTAGRSRSSTC